jgi:ABC-type branched-subunit amino acid transport system substrate-binding protein
MTSVKPYKFGVVYDYGTGEPAIEHQTQVMRMVLEEAYECGQIDRPVELDIRNVPMFPETTAGQTIEHYLKLANDPEIIGIVGPMVTDNTRALTPTLAKVEIPTISYTATDIFGSKWGFLVPNGTFGWEIDIQIAYCAKNGLRRIAVLRENDPIGDEYVHFMRLSGKRHGVEIVATKYFEPFDDAAQVAEKVGEIHKFGADALWYLGFGTRADQVMKAVRQLRDETQWDISCFTITIMTSLPAKLYFVTDMSDWNGWIGLDQIHEGNVLFQQVLDQFERRYGERPFHCFTACFYDIARVICKALEIGKPQTRDQLRSALEKVRNLPSCNGHNDNYISFGPWDHRGYKGRYIVQRVVWEEQNVLLENSPLRERMVESEIG